MHEKEEKKRLEQRIAMLMYVTLREHLFLFYLPSSFPRFFILFLIVFVIFFIVLLRDIFGDFPLSLSLSHLPYTSLLPQLRSSLPLHSPLLPYPSFLLLSSTTLFLIPPPFLRGQMIRGERNPSVGLGQNMGQGQGDIGGVRTVLTSCTIFLLI